MSSFTALNIEPSDEIDDEIDNTKELQIEDALKLYQVALKLHSQGPALFSQAQEGYRNLFSSEIFKYPESITEFDRIEQNPELELADTSLDLDLAGSGADGAPSTLPQILYLTYKNHGQFILDCVKGRCQLDQPDRATDQALGQPSIEYQVKAALDNFVLALVSDQSDTELWRRTARVATTLGSRAIARYCLEAAVEVDDDPTIAEVEPASLEEGFAGEQLKEQLNLLGDTTALSHPIMAPFTKKKMLSYLYKYLDQCPFLPNRTKLLTEAPATDEVNSIDKRVAIQVPQRSWISLGGALCSAFLLPQGLSGTGITLTFPEQSSIQDQIEDQIMADAGTVESPTAESTETTAVTPATSKSDEQSTVAVAAPLSEGSRPLEVVALPNRKRSLSTAGIRETPEEDSGAQKRSKRIRNRDNTEGSVDPSTQYSEQLKIYTRADEDLFGFVGGLLSKLGVDDLGSFADLQSALTSITSERAEVVTNTAVRDLREILKTWDDNKGSTFVNGNAADILGSSAANANAGLAAFLEHSKSGPQKLSSIPLFSQTEGLSSLASKVDARWTPLQDVIFEWIYAVLKTYRGTLWAEDFKVCIVHMISVADAEIFGRFKEEIDQARAGDGNTSTLEAMAQALFELHLDIYSRITNPSSIVNYETRIMAKERLDRWADFATGVVRGRPADSQDELSLRYMWASVFYATMADDVSREHKVFCWTEMQNLLREGENISIELQNNAVMPEISVDAAEREVSRLTTMDFFFNLFQADKSDPVAIIETLEPVLDPESACMRPEAGDTTITEDGTPAALREMWKFLKSGSTSLRLFLWQRLRDAYSSIGYSTKVFSCHLKSIEIIVGDLRADDYVDSAEDPRRHKLLTWLKALDDLLVKALTMALNDAGTCFEIIDERHLRTTCAALAQLTRVLHAAAVFDDEVRIGMTQLPPNQGSFGGFITKLREMQVRVWSLQYALVKEAMSQFPELFTTPDNDLADFLALVHYCLGLRKSCKVSNRIFLKMMKVEMIRLKQVDKWEDYLGQVLYDLYGISLGVGTYLLDDHGCPAEPLDKRTVLNIADQVIVLANRMPIKDLIKHELRPTIEKMQTAAGPVKDTPQMIHNLRNYTEYMKGSLRPLDMYKAFKGQVQVDSLPVITVESPLADKGWYFLLGMIALTKYRSQKRNGPGTPQDDLRVAASFFRLQSQFNGDDWETWFRLAQCFDAELEEEVLWGSEQVNNKRPELVRRQRSAIHCYIMALSTASRTADDSLETAQKLSELYHEFGMRLYASSREPFNMEAFWVDEFEKHMSGPGGMYKKRLHEEMSRYRIWKYAATLFRKALDSQPNYWMNHYMLGKCLWKMFHRVDEEYDPAVKATKPSVDSILGTLVKTIKTVPKPRDGRQDPILEPHYKIVSIVHKLVISGNLQPQTGADLLQRQPYAIQKGEPITIADDTNDWKDFILKSMHHLQSADKQHWHHRMFARVASIFYDTENPDYINASAALHEFRESIFTRTMYINVWKPDAERPGRHCVYMERYIRYICKILFILNDKVNMEQLMKRVKKKSNDTYRFGGATGVWNEVCTSYLSLVRKTGQVQTGMDELFKSVPAEEFEEFSNRLTVWLKDIQMEHPVLEALREAIELKRINAGTIKSTQIDDLINDCWAALYTQVAKNLPGRDPSQLDGEGGITPRAMGPMSLNNLVMDMNGTQIPVPVTFASSDSNRPRKIGVSRRDVTRRAELEISRMPEMPKAVPPPKLRAAQPTPILRSNAGPEQDEEQEQAQEEGGQSHSVSTPRNENSPRPVEEQESAEKKDDSTPPGSVHDSADDESDLSDLPDMDDAIFSEIMGLVTRDAEGSQTEEDEEGEEEEEEEEGEEAEEDEEDEVMEEAPA